MITRSIDGAPKVVAETLKPVEKMRKSINSDADGAETEEHQCKGHAYLSFLNKRIRTYKKKLEKIKALERARDTECKTLNDQQLELVGNRGLVEKMVYEFEILREQFIEASAQEQGEMKVTEKCVETVEEGMVKKIEERTNYSVPATGNVVDQGKVERIDGRENRSIRELLRALHVVGLKQSLGYDVPPVLDFFSKVLLGTTRPPMELSFEDNVAESVEQASRFLTKCDKTFACETTYLELHDLVESLIPTLPNVQINKKDGDETIREKITDVMVEVNDTPLRNEVAASVSVPESMEELPQINFFTDSVLDNTSRTSQGSVSTDMIQKELDTVDISVAAVDEPFVEKELDTVDVSVAVLDEPFVENKLDVSITAADEPVVEKATEVVDGLQLCLSVSPLKTFAAAAASAPSNLTPVADSKWNHKSPCTTIPVDNSLSKEHQRRRSQQRWKNYNSNNESRKKDHKSSEGFKTVNKTRRQRTEENRGLPTVGKSNGEYKNHVDRSTSGSRSVSVTAA